MWLNRLALQAGGGNALSVTCSGDALVGNLWEFLGSPAGPRDVTFIVDGCDAGNIQITADWTAGSTFQITCINQGRIVGLGGRGGSGGADFNTTGEPGSPGADGGNALTGAASQTINVDIDEGFLLGGGGGGGGGSFTRVTSFAGDPGSGGGGGAGFSTTQGGAAGPNTGLPIGIRGEDGGPTGPGAGAEGIGLRDGTDGGDGGHWGAGGKSGQSSDLSTGSAQTFFYYGGVGGRGGRAFAPNTSTLNFNGTLTETELRANEQLRGETTDVIASFPGVRLQRVVSHSGLTTHGYTFETDGTLTLVNSSAGNTSLFRYYSSIAPTASVGFGADYEVRKRNESGSDDSSGTWDNQPGADGTFFALSGARSWTIETNSFRGAVGLFEIRLASAPAGDIIDSLHLKIVDENGA